MNLCKKFCLCCRKHPLLENKAYHDITKTLLKETESLQLTYYTYFKCTVRRWKKSTVNSHLIELPNKPWLFLLHVWLWSGLWLNCILVCFSETIRDNVHSHLCHAKRPMAVSFLTTTPLLKTAIPKWEIFPTFWRPIFWSGAGFPPGPSQLFFSNGRVCRNIKNGINMEYVLLNC